MTRLSAVIITRNEEANLRRCLESVSFADELIVVDSDSTDKTTSIAREMGAKVYSNEWKGYGAAKQEGVNQARGQWILSIDADEQIPSELAKEIVKTIKSSNGTAGFYINRKSMFLGRWILHCGWYPDYVLRLFQRDKGRFDEAIVHEKVVADGEIGFLKGEILHYSYPDLESYMQKFNRYTTLGAEEEFRKGNKSGYFSVLIKPPVAFIKYYIIKLGFLDGLEGFILSVLSSMSVFVKYTKLRALNKKAGN